MASNIHELAAEHPHTHRVYLFGGGAGELWNFPAQGVSEVYNDLDGKLVNFFRVLRDPEAFEDFCRQVAVLPVSRDIWENAGEQVFEHVTEAVNLFIRVRQSYNSKQQSFVASRGAIRRGMNAKVSAWLSAIDGLPEVHERLQRVFIENMDALQLLKRDDSPDTLFYADPPYVHETRTHADIYAYEYTDAQHDSLIKSLLGIRGSAILSGYDCRAYEPLDAAGWRRTIVDQPLRGGMSRDGAATLYRQEILWSNF